MIGNEEVTEPTKRLSDLHKVNGIREMSIVSYQSEMFAR